MVFDVLAVEGLSTTVLPYRKRRELLEELDSKGLRAACRDLRGRPGAVRRVCEQGLEGVVAKRLRDPYRPGERLWEKTKNRSTTTLRRRARPSDRTTTPASGRVSILGRSYVERGEPVVVLIEWGSSVGDVGLRAYCGRVRYPGYSPRMCRERRSRVTTLIVLTAALVSAVGRGERECVCASQRWRDNLHES